MFSEKMKQWINTYKVLWIDFYNGNLPSFKSLLFIFYPVIFISIIYLNFESPYCLEFIPNAVNHGKCKGTIFVVLWLICDIVGLLTLKNVEKHKENIYLEYLAYISVFIVFSYPFQSLIFLIFIGLFTGPFS